MCIDIEDTYLSSPMDRYEYIHMLLDIILEVFIVDHDLSPHAKNNIIYMLIERNMCESPQAGLLTNKLLCKQLAPHGYFKPLHTPSLWKHIHHLFK